MPDIGASLREARMRARIDISEIEAQTKIRAKYLRALENEEWDLLPGPTYVKSFLRTYAEALDLDAKLLVDEYKLRHERLSEVELQPINAAAPGRERRRQTPMLPPWFFVAVIFVGAGLRAVPARLGGDDPTTSRHADAADRRRPRSAQPRRRRRPQRRPRPTRVRLRIEATGPVYVCLKAGDRTLVNGETLEAGQRTPTFRSRRFRLTLGNNAAILRINGKPRRVAASSEPIGCEITPGRGRQPLSARERPVCRRDARAMSVRAGIVVTGTEVLTGRVVGSQRPVAVRAAARARRRSDRDRGRRRPARRHPARAALPRGRGLRADLHERRPRARRPTTSRPRSSGEFQGREMVLDEALEGRIAEILRPLMARWPDLDPAAMLVSNRKQAVIPAGAEILEPVGTAPGPRRDAGRRRRRVTGRPSSCCPGRRASCSRCGARRSRRARRCARRCAGAVEYRRDMLRLYGIPESEIAATLRAAAGRRHRARAPGDHDVPAPRRGRGRHALRARRRRRSTTQFAALVRERHRRTLFSDDGTTVDEQVFALLRGDGSRPVQTIAVAESCTGGLLCARLTERPGSSEFVRGGLVVYSNDGEGRARRRRPGADRARRRGLRGGRGGARRRRARRAGRRRRRRDHRHRRARRRDARPSPSGSSGCRSATATAAG